MTERCRYTRSFHRIRASVTYGSGSASRSAPSGTWPVMPPPAQSSFIGTTTTGWHPGASAIRLARYWIVAPSWQDSARCSITRRRVVFLGSSSTTAVGDHGLRAIHCAIASPVGPNILFLISTLARTPGLSGRIAARRRPCWPTIGSLSESFTRATPPPSARAISAGAAIRRKRSGSLWARTSMSTGESWRRGHYASLSR